MIRFLSAHRFRMGRVTARPCAAGSALSTDKPLPEGCWGALQTWQNCCHGGRETQTSRSCRLGESLLKGMGERLSRVSVQRDGELWPSCQTIASNANFKWDNELEIQLIFSKHGTILTDLFFLLRAATTWSTTQSSVDGAQLLHFSNLLFLCYFCSLLGILGSKKAFVPLPPLFFQYVFGVTGIFFLLWYLVFARQMKHLKRTALRNWIKTCKAEILRQGFKKNKGAADISDTAQEPDQMLLSPDLVPGSAGAVGASAAARKTDTVSAQNGKFSLAKVLSNLKEAQKGAGPETSSEMWKYFGLLCPSLKFTRYLKHMRTFRHMNTCTDSVRSFTRVNAGIGSLVSLNEKCRNNPCTSSLGHK